MNGLAQFRSAQHARYLARQAEEERLAEAQRQAEEERQAEAQLAEQHHSDTVRSFCDAMDAIIARLYGTDDVQDAIDAVHMANELFDADADVLGHDCATEAVQPLGQSILEAIDSAGVMVNFRSIENVTLCHDLKMEVRNFLIKVRNIGAHDELPLEIEMACDKDEELARQLHRELNGET